MKVSIVFSNADGYGVAKSLLQEFGGANQTNLVADGVSLLAGANIAGDRFLELKMAIAAINAQIDEHSNTYILSK